VSSHAATVTVVVATYRRPDRLARLLRALEAQTLPPPWDVVVVDDHSPLDAWAAVQAVVAASPLPIRLIRRERNGGPGLARETGWRAVEAPLVAFTDDDCTPEPGWLAAIVDGLDGAGLVQGRTLPHPEQLASMGPFGRTLVEEEEGLYPTCNMGYRREVLELVGGFDPRFTISCEDTDLAMRALEAGATSAWAPEAVVYHDVHPSSYRDFLRDKLRWHGVALVVRQHPALRSKLVRRVFWKRSHPPALLALAGLLVALRRRPSGLAVAAASAVPYFRFRTVDAPLPGASRRRRLLLLPLVLVADWLEIGVLVRASARYRTVVL
jgi:GT2 family glycosyltransferase